MSRYNIVSTVFLVLFIGSISLDGALQIPYEWYVGLIVFYVALTLIGAAVLSIQYFVPVRYRGTNPKTIAITFDDGPIQGKTDRILDILKTYNVNATFFCIGHRAQKNPTILKRIHSEGHLIGNHSYWHSTTFDFKSSSMIMKELYDTDKVVFDILGCKLRFFRPPYGVTNPMVAKAVAKRNYTVVGWSVRSFDSVTKDKEKLFMRLTKNLKGGDILLFHDYSETMIEILPKFIEHVNSSGLKIDSLDRLINQKAYG